jgi:heme/copper-type cytochrome/quinol oxidase subunit 2
MTCVLAALLVSPFPALACAVCFGEPDAPMTRGLNWAILVLGGVVAVVLTGVAGFFVYVQRRTARQPQSVSFPAGPKNSNL